MYVRQHGRAPASADADDNAREGDNLIRRRRSILGTHGHYRIRLVEDTPLLFRTVRGLQYFSRLSALPYLF